MQFDQKTLELTAEISLLLNYRITGISQDFIGFTKSGDSEFEFDALLNLKERCLYAPIDLCEIDTLYILRGMADSFDFKFDYEHL